MAQKFGQRKLIMSNISTPQANLLYVGTTEQIAKLAPHKGLTPPVFLTDIYPGFFCKQDCQNGRWGIISINVGKLYKEMFAPSPAYIDRLSKKQTKEAPSERYQKILDRISDHKTKWQKSLTSSGVCLYLDNIPPSAIEKVMIYDTVGNSTNNHINKLLSELPSPYDLTPAEHKALYNKASCLLNWLNGKETDCFNGEADNRMGLDLYYTKPEEKMRKIAAKKIKE